jgi:glutathione S-transferase
LEDAVVQLVDADIKTREVLDWKGIHVLHGTMSTCSKKLRIYLNLKGIPWQSRIVDLPNNENMSAWYLGINPRGLVPVLVHDGVVHIESNDIIAYLEARFPQPQLIPAGYETKVARLLRHEDDLHLDIRTLSFRFVFDPTKPRKSKEDLKRYGELGSGTVRGKKYVEIAHQVDFWSRYVVHGITDEQARASALKFREEFDGLERTLSKQPYLMGDRLSVLDIAWFIYIGRLTLAGYPFRRLHPRVSEWFAGLMQRPEFAKEVTLSEEFGKRLAANRRAQTDAGRSLELVAGF